MAIRAATIVLLCSVLLVFFVPAGAGPFSAVHGPATALRAHRAAQVFYSHLALSARNFVATLMLPVDVVSSPVSSAGVFTGTEASALPSPLRC